MTKFTFLTFLFFSFIGFSQQNTINLKSKNLKGKVQSFEKTTFLVDKTTKNLTQKYKENYVFDSDGLLISIENFGDDTQPDSKETYSYNQTKLSLHSVLSSTGKIDKTTQYEYDEVGQLITQKKYNKSEKLQYQTSYLYNQKGLLSAKHKLIPSINYTMKQHYKYNAKDQLIEIAKIARIGTTKETFEYNDKGLQAKKSEYNAMGELYSYIDYFYNIENDKTDLKKYDTEGALTYFENYEYAYDATGNWTERSSFEKGEKVSIEKRVIVYR